MLAWAIPALFLVGAAMAALAWSAEDLKMGSFWMLSTSLAACVDIAVVLYGMLVQARRLEAQAAEEKLAERLAKLSLELPRGGWTFKPGR